MKKKQIDETCYPVELTGEQIKLIRTLYLRAEHIWVRHIFGQEVLKNGEMSDIRIWQCWFCNRGSYESAHAINHDKNCIIPDLDREWEKMSALFNIVMSAEEKAL